MYRCTYIYTYAYTCIYVVTQAKQGETGPDFGGRPALLSCPILRHILYILVSAAGLGMFRAAIGMKKSTVIDSRCRCKQALAQVTLKYCIEF